MRYHTIERHASLFEEYTELRIQENRSASVVFLKGNMTRNQKTASAGVSARVFKKGVWGFASDPIVSDESIAGAVRAATRNARFLAGKEGRASGALPSRAGRAELDLSTKKPRLGQGELIEFVKALDAGIAARYPKLLSRIIALNSLDMEKTLFSSDGGTSYSLIPRTNIYLSLSVEAGGEPVEIYSVIGGRGQFEEVFTTPEALEPKIEELYGHLLRKAEGVYPEAGTHEVLLGPDLAGILAHEAIGHTVEGDLVLGGSVAGDRFGQVVASELITMTDYAHSAFGQLCPVPLLVDDEGTEARDAVLIEKGVLKSFMHNKETAEKLGHEPTGNARAFAFSDEPLVRMRNTAIAPGTSSLSDMIASLDDGYYFMKSSNGQADSTSEFMFGVVQGYEVKKGKLGRALRDTTISGVAFDMLKTVSAVSNDLSWSQGGMCGKKQMIPVGMGGPAIRCRINVGGR